MKAKMKFNSPELQKAYEDLIESQNDPKNIARWNEQLQEDRKSYWTSLPFVMVLATILPLAFATWLVQQPGFNFDPIGFIVPILLPIGTFFITWPRRRW